jgi:hypothetical protein
MMQHAIKNDQINDFPTHRLSMGWRQVAQSHYQIEYVAIHNTTVAHDEVARQFLKGFDSISPVIEEPIVRTVSIVSI